MLDGKIINESGCILKFGLLVCFCVLSWLDFDWRWWSIVYQCTTIAGLQLPFKMLGLKTCFSSLIDASMNRPGQFLFGWQAGGSLDLHFALIVDAHAWNGDKSATASSIYCVIHTAVTGTGVQHSPDFGHHWNRSNSTENLQVQFSHCLLPEVINVCHKPLSGFLLVALVTVY